MYVQNALPKDLDKNDAIVDSGCSRHMMGNKDFRVEFKEIKEEKVVVDGDTGYFSG